MVWCIMCYVPSGKINPNPAYVSVCSVAVVFSTYLDLDSVTGAFRAAAEQQEEVNRRFALYAPLRTYLSNEVRVKTAARARGAGFHTYHGSSTFWGEPFLQAIRQLTG